MNSLPHSPNLYELARDLTVPVHEIGAGIRWAFAQHLQGGSAGLDFHIWEFAMLGEDEVLVVGEAMAWPFICWLHRDERWLVHYFGDEVFEHYTLGRGGNPTDWLDHLPAHCRTAASKSRFLEDRGTPARS